ncbi:MAG: hypothetical protein ACREA2_10860 [Blastocatellia bacterium]
MPHDGTLTLPKVTSITAAQPQAYAKFTITASIDGFPVSVEVEGKADSLRAMIDRLKAIGATPPQTTSKASNAAGTPLCPTHNTPMKPSRKPGKFYCAKKADDGEYCRETA